MSLKVNKNIGITNNGRIVQKYIYIYILLGEFGLDEY